MNENIRKQIAEIRTEFEKASGVYVENTVCNFGSAWYPKTFKGDVEGEMAVALIADGEPQGFAFFINDTFSGRTEESYDGDVFNGVTSTEQVFERIRSFMFSEENQECARINNAGAIMGKSIATHIWGGK